MHGSIETSHWPKLINMRHFRFLKTLPPNGPFPSNSFSYFFQPKKPLLILRVKPLFFLFFTFLSFLSPRSFFFSFLFPFLPLGRLFTQMTGNSIGWFSKNRLEVSKEFCQSFKVCHFKVVNGVLGHLASMLLISQNLIAGFLKTLPPNGPFASNSFFSAENNL